MNTNVKKLITEALIARENSYAPYSKFRVGAALCSKQENIYRGCNIENAAYTPSNCAERTAFFTAIASGEREFTAIAIVGGKGEEMVAPSPCGVCRQVMMEFCDPNTFEIILAKNTEDYEILTLEQLYPRGFKL